MEQSKSDSSIANDVLHSDNHSKLTPEEIANHPESLTGKYLSGALIEHYKEKSDAGLDTYSERCLHRIWRAERFSWWFTSLMHRFPDGGPIGAKLQDAELDYLFNSEHAARTVAENYVGLPLDFGDPRRRA
jgi:hypothetical protein